MQSRARRLSTGLTIALATGTATIFAAPAAFAAPSPFVVTCGSTVTGTSGAPVALRTDGTLYNILNAAAADAVNNGAAADAHQRDLLLNLPQEFQALGTIRLGSVGAGTYGTGSISRVVSKAVTGLPSYPELQASAPDAATAVLGGTQDGISGSACAVSTHVRTVALPKPRPASGHHPVSTAGGHQRDRELTHPGTPETTTGTQPQSAAPVGQALRHSTPQPLGSSELKPVFTADAQPGGADFTGTSGGLFHPPGTTSGVIRTGDAVPLATGEPSTSDSFGIALLVAVLALSGVSAAAVRIWAVRRLYG